MEVIIEFLFVIVFAVLGNYANLWKTFDSLDKQFPEKTIAEIKALFWEHEAAFIMFGIPFVFTLNIAMQAALAYYTDVFTYDFPINVFGWFSFDFPVVILSFVFAFCFNFFGQLLIYKWLGKAQSYLESKIEK